MKTLTEKFWNMLTQQTGVSRKEFALYMKLKRNHNPFDYRSPDLNKRAWDEHQKIDKKLRGDPTLAKHYYSPTTAHTCCSVMTLSGFDGNDVELFYQLLHVMRSNMRGAIFFSVRKQTTQQFIDMGGQISHELESNYRTDKGSMSLMCINLNPDRLEDEDAPAETKGLKWEFPAEPVVEQPAVVAQTVKKSPVGEVEITVTKIRQPRDHRGRFTVGDFNDLTY